MSMPDKPGRVFCWPASLSYSLLTDLVRQMMGFSDAPFSSHSLAPALHLLCTPALYVR